MRLATMDVVGGVIVAAQSSKTGSSGEPRGRLSGMKRSCGCRGRDHCGKDTASSLTEQAAPVWRSLRSAGELPYEGWKSTTTTTAKSNLQRWGMVVESKGGGVEREADDECNNDLRNALSCAASEGGSLGGSEHGLRNGVILGGLRESAEVKIESLSTGIMNFEPGSVNSAPSVSDGGLFFWTSAPCTYGSCLLKSPDPYLISTTVATDPFSGVCHGSSPEAERDRQKALMFDDSSLSLGPRIMTTERSEGEPPPKRATRSSLQIGSLNLRKQDVEASSASRLARSTSAFGDGFSQESTGALMAPLFRSNSSMFSKPARSWADPLRFLLKKELTVTDVGELGRIILPKRDAEFQLPHLDSKEGKLLIMEDYNSNKHWTLRYKWWPNNKSRMYVLESTGEFVKYYDLKEKDELIVYKDGHGKLVIRGQKWSSSAILRTDSFLGPSGFKSKSTGKRSPKGGNCRSNICKSSPTASSSNSSAQPSNNYQALDSPHEHESADVLDFKLGPATSLVTHIMATQQASQRTTRTPSPPYNDGFTKLHQLDVPTSQVANMHPKISLNTLDCGMVPGSVHPTSASSLQYHVEPSEIAPIGNYGAVAVHSDGAIDWEKLPDPPGNSIEFPDPPAIEFPDPPAIEFPIEEFECSWAEFS